MSDLKFNQDEFREAINDLIPTYQQDQLLNAFALSEVSEFDELGLTLTGEKINSSLIIPTSAPTDSSKSMWSAIKAEVYEFLCTKSRKYSKERKDSSVTIKNVITIITTAVASDFDLAVGVITGAVTVALLSALKISRNAWCSINTPET